MPQVDPLERAIENALQPNTFIGWREVSDFIEGLEVVAGDVEKLLGTDASRAVRLFETFIAGCFEKANDVDDSGGSLVMFVETLFSGWIKARAAADADPDQTAKMILGWMDKDDFGLCHQLEQEVVKVFRKNGLAAFEREVRARHETSQENERRRAGDILRVIYAQQRNVQAYLALCEKTEISQKDCLAVATMLKSSRKLDEALSWVERGLAANESTSAYELTRMKRDILMKLDRGGDAVADVWAGFEAHPSTFTYEELMRFVPNTERATWHTKAMEASQGSNLDSVIELWLETNEVSLLVDRLRKTSDAALENLSHYTTEPAAKKLAKEYPDLAARIFRALGMRILTAKKSKYYDAALSNFESAKECYERAGLARDWDAIVTLVREVHHRKVRFMNGFDKLALGRRPSDEPSFLDLARKRWGPSQDQEK